LRRGPGAPYQPFAEALRSLLPSLGASRLRGCARRSAPRIWFPDSPTSYRDLAAPDARRPDTERYALFDAVVAVCSESPPTNAPVVLILLQTCTGRRADVASPAAISALGEHARVQARSAPTAAPTSIARHSFWRRCSPTFNRDGSHAPSAQRPRPGRRECITSPRPATTTKSWPGTGDGNGW